MTIPAILCIDDEELGLEIRRIVLEREGYTVLTADDGPSGLSSSTPGISTQSFSTMSCPDSTAAR